MDLRFFTRDHFPDLFGVWAELKLVAAINIDGWDKSRIDAFRKSCEEGEVVCKIPGAGVKKSDECHVALISRSETLVSRLEGPYLDNDVRAHGKLLGYPACCIDAWQSGVEAQQNELISSVIKKSKSPSSYLNIFSVGNRLIPHSPCSLDCEKSHELSKLTLKKLKEVDSEKAAQVKQDLNLPVLVKDSQIFLKFKKTDQGLEFKWIEDQRPYLNGYVTRLSEANDKNLHQIGTSFAQLWNKRGGFPNGEPFSEFHWIDWKKTIQ
ncbi:MAG: DUF483 domain-containing protein [Candidatus Altiarchaeota archaeon]|nr:DUF483 domain-containing protein [Candidatus Altiarchaeota archaeon]